MITQAMIENFPPSPGVYLMKSADDTVIYVGKARNLKKRVRSYAGDTRDSRIHIRFMVQLVHSVDYLVTDTEKEALILENTLIKQHRPKYNINLRDDKTYFSLRMDMKEQFPRLSIVRKIPSDGARYFGPYASATAAKEVLKQLYKMFPLRHYPLATCMARKRPCLYHQIKQCSAPCCGLISAAEYAALAHGAALFLEGKNTEVARLYRSKMNLAAEQMRYEDAARYRDLLRAIEVTVERQKMVAQSDDSDVFGLHREADRMQIALLHIRGGTLTGGRSFLFDWELETEEGLASFLNEYYDLDAPIPPQVLIPVPIAEPAALEELLSEKAGKKVTIAVPQRGPKLEMVKLAGKNAETAAQERLARESSSATLLTELAEKLNLPHPPRRIECYDISNIQGEMAVGSRVVFIDGRADKSLYRRYRIKGVLQSDDFAMMREVLSRRFKAESSEEKPDLIVVDGGLGQLGVLNAVLDELEVTGVEAAGLAKSRVARDMESEEIERSDERVFRPGRKNAIALRQSSAPLLLLVRIRDEAHRFAVTYHKDVRSKVLTGSELDGVAGIGEKRKKALLKHFGSLKRVKEATLEELKGAPGMTESAAKALVERLHGSPLPNPPPPGEGAMDRK
ncbi:excinuclease ABC, C subunit [Citrifermentans bemidjiense Bem]|uniref:UvrABC system protein C n=1 Tax=Citrifermentans bemidjiense (strain ATCC BAA-1014 / DSM 16622 / JCM 12645 / Bem) TaxID=404380 RepID=UVRC_CITBB|nr:excinuclease ABC subunit UvrC [Citrifermentans bemidjiense]B5EG40.1 RecName: Full=UvrABC system protein C; Short=Protein UvrC; AltName: Full=Excinuclease ABC subunit C [Citrifermentans bemidjiense Bem]ACH40953.1 excinuclease ABC, C subunit [Citrifermentans bemidjiense Bem]